VKIAILLSHFRTLLGVIILLYSCGTHSSFLSVAHADEAPPPPPSTDKPSPPPQQRDGAAHAKAVPAAPATSPLAPTAAIAPAAPQPPHSGASSEGITCAILIIIIGIIIWSFRQH
jgi:hypothetical protein